MIDSGLAEWLHECLGPVGRLRIRRMFGGAGISLDGVTFALFFGDALYLKSDTEIRAAFDAGGLEPFAYARRDRRVVTS